MKTLILIAAFVGLFNAANAQNVITSEEVKIAITSETTREDLMQLRQQLFAQGIDFQYNPMFDGQRKLTGISLQIKTGDVEGQAENKNLNQIGQVMSIHLVKDSEGKFGIECLGKCTLD
ncbi:MAG: hypothetical protein JNM00_03520 [Flavobacteriales bacterium]|nr:hypothetical protein [Flavobacteriales bacterium]